MDPTNPPTSLFRFIDYNSIFIYLQINFDCKVEFCRRKKNKPGYIVIKFYQTLPEKMTGD